MNAQQRSFSGEHRPSADKPLVGSLTAVKIALPAWAVPERSRCQMDSRLRVAEVVSALSHALDLGNGGAVGHSVRACILAQRIADEIGLPIAERQDLYYAALLKDAGCSTNASKMFHTFATDDIKAKRDVKTADWTRIGWENVQYALSHAGTGKPFLERMRILTNLALNSKQHAHDVVKIRCERGAAIARLIGLPDLTADAIGSLDEHWDGHGEPDGLRKNAIPMLSRIILLAQTLEVFFSAKSPAEAVAVVKRRSGRWFDPSLVKAVESLDARQALWSDIADEFAFTMVLAVEPFQKTMTVDDTTFDAICTAFAQVVDAKSPFTYRHSNGVANAAVAIARHLKLDRKRIVFLRHAALLHDIGKMGISNAILEKPGRLDETEWQSMRLHPFYTWKILHAIPRFGEMSEVAASHHEKLDGSGYFRGLTAAQMPVEARILVIADIFDALSAARPYRAALPLEEVFKIMRRDAPHALDADCLDALERSGAGSDQSVLDLQTLNERLTHA